jgi:hypothetical protein
MINLERPCCDAPLATELPLPDELFCDECAVSWVVTDAESRSALPSSGLLAA